MGHDYGIVPKFLSITPTRDNISAPGNRMPDKHSRLFHGRSLDEWTMLQLWSSKYLGKAIFVCETETHAMRLETLAHKYGVELVVRPEQMLAPVCDTGGVPCQWATRRELRKTWWALFTIAFVVAPCRPPGFLDMMVERYLEAFNKAPDFHEGQHWVCAGHDADEHPFQTDSTGTAREQLGHLYNRADELVMSDTGHFMASTFWYVNHTIVDFGRHAGVVLTPKMFKVPWWQCIHIDTEEQWTAAEFYFGNYILNAGFDCYEKYRASWEGKC